MTNHRDSIRRHMLVIQLLLIALPFTIFFYLFQNTHTSLTSLHLLILVLTLMLVLIGTWGLRRVFETLFDLVRMLKTASTSKNISLQIDAEKAELHQINTGFSHLLQKFEKTANELISVKNALHKEVSIRKKAQRALEESEEKYRIIFENIRYGFYEMDLNGKIRFANKIFPKLFEMSEREIIGKKIDLLLNAENGTKFAHGAQALLNSNNGSITLPLEIGRNGGEPRILEAMIFRVVDSKGESTGFRGIVRDITDIKITEKIRKKLEERLRMTQKLESLGTLAGGIAHNFNNLLTGILGNSSLAQLNMDEKHPVSQRLKNIDNLVQSGAKLTRELLGYAREGRFDPAPMDLNAVITSMADTFSAMRKNICVSCKLDPVLPPVMADAGQVEQVLMNLFINSAEAMPDGGDIQLKTRRIDYRKIADTIYQVKPNRYVELTVTDTGSGMSADTLAHIFEPFFTTKDISNAGRGLGLASVYGIVKGHGGYIDADSEEEKGTRMRVFLPISNQPLSRFTEHKDTHCTRGYGTILMVDDETMVLESGGSMLREMGYTVLEAQSGKEALKRLTYCSHEIHLVLLDLTMPGMSGSETFDRIKALDPELKVLLCSGYSLDGEASNILDRGCEGFIQKPFSMSELQEKIQCILNPQRR